MSKRVLVVDDDAPIRKMVCRILQLGRPDLVLEQAEDGKQALDALEEQTYDLLILDFVMPVMGGLDVLKAVRERGLLLPIIMLTARADERDRVLGLDSGADDYITKPFSPRELLSRVNAVLRRSAPAADEPLVAGELRLDPVSHRVYAGEREIGLGPTEYRLLKFLMENPDRVYSRTQVLDNVWGQNVYVEERTVDVHIRRLRQVLEDFAADHYVQTVRGAGYRFSVC